MALIEAKVGNTDLTAEQVETYVELAKQNGISALIAISIDDTSSLLSNRVA